MTPEQVGRILAAAAARDARTVGAGDIIAWHQDIGDLDFDDALAAVSRHYREHTDRIMPAHVRRLAASIRRERVDAAPLCHHCGQSTLGAYHRRMCQAPPTPPAISDRSRDVRQLVASLAARAAITRPTEETAR